MSKRGYVHICSDANMLAILAIQWEYTDLSCNSRGGASGNKLKMTLGLPVYVSSIMLLPRPRSSRIPNAQPFFGGNEPRRRRTLPR